MAKKKKKKAPVSRGFEKVMSRGKGGEITQAEKNESKAPKRTKLVVRQRPKQGVITPEEDSAKTRLFRGMEYMSSEQYERAYDELNIAYSRFESKGVLQRIIISSLVKSMAGLDKPVSSYPWKEIPEVMTVDELIEDIYENQSIDMAEEKLMELIDSIEEEGTYIYGNLHIIAQRLNDDARFEVSNIATSDCLVKIAEQS